MPGFLTWPLVASIGGMIVLFTDFGVADPYVGQMHGMLAREAPGVPVIDLFHAVPNYDIRAAAISAGVRAGVSAGVGVRMCRGPGRGQRPPAGDAARRRRWFVGPDNGLFHILARRDPAHACRHIRWSPRRLS